MCLVTQSKFCCLSSSHYPITPLWRFIASTHIAVTKNVVHLNRVTQQAPRAVDSGLTLSAASLSFFSSSNCNIGSLVALRPSNKTVPCDFFSFSFSFSF